MRVGVYLQCSSYTTRAGCKYEWIRNKPFLSSHPTIRMVAPGKENVSLIRDIRQILHNNFSIMLHDTFQPAMLLTSRAHDVWTETMLEACRMAGVTSYIFIVYGQKQMLRHGADILDDICDNHGVRVIGDENPVSLIVDLAMTSRSVSMPLMRAGNDVRAVVDNLQHYPMFWTKYGGLSFTWRNLRFKYYLTVVHQLKASIRHLDAMPRQVVTFQRRGEALKQLWLRYVD